MELDTHKPALEPGDNPTYEQENRTVSGRMKKVRDALGRVGRGFSEFMDASNVSHDAISSAMVEKIKEISAEQRTELTNQALDLEQFQLLESGGIPRETLGAAIRHGVALARQIRNMQTGKPRSDAERRARLATPDVERKNIAIERGVQAGMKDVEAQSEVSLDDESKAALETMLRSVITDNIDDARYGQRIHRVHGALQHTE